MGIGTSTPDSSARLQIDANAATNAKGFLLPRVTATEKNSIVSPATGLIVYQTDGTTGFYYYDGSSWQLLPSASNAVPYSGATGAVNLGNYDLTVNGLTVGRGTGNIWSNAASGYQALSSNTTGGYNTASGYQTLYSNTSGYYNTASGYQALYSNTSGYYNTASGYQSLWYNTTGNYNTASGYQALYSNTTGTFNIASGCQALYSNTTGTYNIASGFRALYSNTTGSYNIASGFAALYYNTTGLQNTASGYYALYANTIGWLNTAYGLEALYSNTTGNYNTAIGTDALYNNTTGNANTAIGRNAGSNLTTGSNNTLIGYNAQTSSSSISNEITLGDNRIALLRCNATTITALSDRRDKTDITPIVEGLAFLKQLNPVSFTWNTRDKAKVGIKSAGFIAQELLALQKQSNIGDNLDLVSENNPEKLEARYGNLLPVIVKAIQEESAEKDKKINELKLEKDKEILLLKIKSTEKDAEIDALKQRLDTLEKKFNQILTKSNK